MAATVDTFGPKPTLRTMYGYEAPISTATNNPHTMARGENSRKSFGLGRARDAECSVDAPLSCDMMEPSLGDTRLESRRASLIPAVPGYHAPAVPGCQRHPAQSPVRSSRRTEVSS